MTASSTRHLVDPELLPFLDMLPALALSDESLAEVRGRSFLMPVDPEAIENVDLQRRMIPGPAGAPQVEVLVFTPRAPAPIRPCILHIHGGGYISGSAEGGEAALRPAAADLDCIIVSVNYRLAPETVCPGAVEDCYAALAWLFASAAELGVDTARVAVKGESAGGGLAAALALLARDRGEYRLAFQSLTYPMLDDRTCVAKEPNPQTGEFLWTRHNNHYGWKALLGMEPGSDGVSPYAAPARAQDLSGLPPTFIATTTLDLFVNENIVFAERLIRAGVPCELHIYPGGFHAFDIAPTAKVSIAARRDTREALRRALYPA
jgi:acetyl esterase/lipase